jgi:hypothetical protein
MNRPARWAVVALGFALLLFGLGCLNYTKAGGLEHHTNFAREHGLPPPSERILFLGALALIIGAGLEGYAIGKGARPAAVSSERSYPD